MIKRIFLDLDDVLNDCTMSALNYVGCPVKPFEFEKFNPEWGWDIVKAANELHRYSHFTEISFWEGVKRNFWALAPQSREFIKLLTWSSEAVGEKNVFILTTPTSDPDCLAGKLEWIKSYCPSWIHRQYLMGPRKIVCAQDGALLIDDSQKNIIEFREHGGMAVTMPRPWNDYCDIQDTISYFRHVFKRLFPGKKFI